MPEVIHNLIALGTVAILLLAWRGFVGHTLRWHVQERSATFHLALGTCALIWAVVFRSLYWDLGPDILDWYQPGLWERWGVASGWSDVNIIWDVLLVFGSWHLLRALQLLVPEEERHLWPLWKAPFYPHGGVLGRIWAWLRGN